MARIRSIKPDFFTSETIASLPITARLTFIGLWTHADDNGVCQDNVRLIVAAIWPLEEDPLETLWRTREDLSALCEAGLLTRYEVAGRRFIHINSWDEHQKVSHPGKPRFPKPGHPDAQRLTCRNTESPEGLGRLSGDSPNGLANSSALSREQGAGSREQGSQLISPYEPEPPQGGWAETERDEEVIIEPQDGYPRSLAAFGDKLRASYGAHDPDESIGCLVAEVAERLSVAEHLARAVVQAIAEKRRPAKLAKYVLPFRDDQLRKVLGETAAWHDEERERLRADAAEQRRRDREMLAERRAIPRPDAAVVQIHSESARAAIRAARRATKHPPDPASEQEAS